MRPQFYSLEYPDSCIYDACTSACKYCFECGAPLCSFCGARDRSGNVYCNECFAWLEELSGITDPEP